MCRCEGLRAQSGELSTHSHREAMFARGHTEIPPARSPAFRAPHDMTAPGRSSLSQTRGRRQQPARHPPPPRPPHPCLAPSAQPSDERAGEARGASDQGEALAMSSFVACLQPTLDGATASKLILVIRVRLMTESFLQHLPIPNPAQLNYSIFFFFQAQMWPE